MIDIEQVLKKLTLEDKLELIDAFEKLIKAHNEAELEQASKLI